MHNLGDVVFYGAQGICKIDNIETKEIGKLATDYYVLKPVFNLNTALFVPVDNDVLVAKMQPILNIAQAEQLVASLKCIEIVMLESESLRRETYKSILSNGDRTQLLSLIKTIRQERDIRRDCGKKLNINDEQVLRKAELLIGNELAYVLKIAPEEAQKLIEF
ncbi:MAG: hypothetical protein IJE02_00805 [Clostridia bacterium]|nr:hypothetical protein [Clostridia bacterium]